MGNKSSVSAGFVALGLALLVTGLLGSCQAPLVLSGGSGSVRLALNVPAYASSKSLIQASGGSARYIPSSADRAVIVISAPDMADIVKKVDNLPGLNPKSVQIDGIPIGYGRTITVTIYDAADTIVSVGAVTLTIRAGLNQTQAITALPNVPSANQLAGGADYLDIPPSSKAGDFFYSKYLSPGLYDSYYSVDSGGKGYVAQSWLTVIDPDGQQVSASSGSFDNCHAAFWAKKSGSYFFAVSVPGAQTSGARLSVNPQSRTIAPTESSSGILTLTWNSVLAAKGYLVYQSTTNDPNTATLIAQQTSTKCYTPQLAKSTSYYFWVKAINSADDKASDFLGFGASGEFAVGDTGPGGGVIFYDRGAYDPTTKWRYLECAPPYWKGSSVDPIAAWSNMTGTAIGSTQTGLGSGKENTQFIISQLGHKFSAAQLCLSYRGGGFFDWHLPSTMELERMLNLSLTGKTKIITTDPGYWSSFEKEAGSASAGFYKEGTPSLSSFDKSKEMRIRPIRRF